MSKRISVEATEPLQVLFLDRGGVPQTGLTPAIAIRRTTDNQFWDDVSAYQATDPGLTMTEVDDTESPGWYTYDFVASDGATETDHSWEAADSGSNNGPFVGSFHVGEEWENIVNIADVVWDEILTGATHNIATSAGKRLRQASGVEGVTDGTAQAGAATTITLAVGESAVDDEFNEYLIGIVEGPGSSPVQIRMITAYDGTTKIATVHRPWAVNPEGTSNYVIGRLNASRPADDALNAVRDAILSDGIRFEGGLQNYAGFLWFDSFGGSPGAVVGTNGTQSNPVSDEADLRTLAAATGIRRIKVTGTLTLAATYTRYEFSAGTGPGSTSCVVNLGSRTVNASLYNVGVRGILGGGRISAYDCDLAAGFTGTGDFYHCLVGGTHALTDGSITSYFGCYGRRVSNFWSVSFALSAGGATKAVIWGFEGEIGISELGMAGSGDTVDISMKGLLDFDAACVGGTATVAGMGKITNLGSGFTLDQSAFIAAGDVIDAAGITAAVWGVTEVAMVAAGEAGLLTVAGLSGRAEIDLTGSDLLGWQLVEFNTADVEIRRSNLFDEAFARIPATVTVQQFQNDRKAILRIDPL